MKPTLMHSLSGFDSITLDQLNSTMSLMERVDTKYLINFKQADHLIEAIKNDFFILQIKDKVIFQYDNIYMDTLNNDLFYEHEQGNQMRNKVRTRNYADSNDLCFFEYKHKMNKVTRKFRYKCPVTEHGLMTEESKGFFEGIYESLNGDLPSYDLSASLATRYKRITLCAKNSGEKVTIDFEFEFEDMRTGSTYRLDDIVIIESKSNSEHCTTGAVMKKMKVAQASGCSKYCLGLYYVGRITHTKRFAGSIEVINTITQEANAQKAHQTHKVIKKVSKDVAEMKLITNQISSTQNIATGTFTSKKIPTAA